MLGSSRERPTVLFPRLHLLGLVDLINGDLFPGGPDLPFGSDFIFRRGHDC